MLFMYVYACQQHTHVYLHAKGLKDMASYKIDNHVNGNIEWGVWFTLSKF